MYRVIINYAQLETTVNKVTIVIKLWHYNPKVIIKVTSKLQTGQFWKNSVSFETSKLEMFTWKCHNALVGVYV